MTDTQAELLARARAAKDNLSRGLSALRLEVASAIVDDFATLVWAALQSEREAAAAAFQSEREQRALAYNQLLDDYQKVVREREAAIDHLRNTLYLFADLHPDYTSKSFRNALEFYNAARPDRKVEPSGFELKHFVSESAIQRRCEAAAAEARRAALLQAATLCDGIREEYLAKPRRDPEHTYAAMAGYCVGAIRALASPTPQEETL